MALRLERSSGLNHRRFKALEDFGIYADVKEEDVQPLKGFSDLSFSISPIQMFEIYRQIFERDEGETHQVHYWPDTSFILESGHVYGTRAGISLRLSEGSFMSACAMGLTKLDQEYDVLWKKFNEVKKLHLNQLERIIHRSDVTLIPEVKEELIKGRERRRDKIRQTQNASYQKILSALVERNYRLVRQISEAQEKDETLALLQNIGIASMRDFCQNIAQEYGLTTSITDNTLIAYALAHAAYSGNHQIILTQDQEIAELLALIPSYAQQEANVGVNINYYSSLFLREIEIGVTRKK